MWPRGYVLLTLDTAPLSLHGNGRALKRQTYMIWLP